MTPGLSPLAKLISTPRNITDRASAIPWGICVHTTGGGVPELALKKKISSIDTAVGIYTKPDNPPDDFPPFPHYVIDEKGGIVQIANERERARHVRITEEERVAYKTDAWRAHVSPFGLSRWDAKWGPHSKRNPLQLFPSRSPNEDYLGVELIPRMHPLANGSLFNAEQYDVLASLIEDIESRYGLFFEAGRVVGHEDLSPLTRWDKNGGWDPGQLRKSPTFRWRELQRADGSRIG